ncbi:MAG: hypothetical protein ACREFD_10055 [Stellaceae bacterium]
MTVQSSVDCDDAMNVGTNQYQNGEAVAAEYGRSNRSRRSWRIPTHFSPPQSLWLLQVALIPVEPAHNGKRWWNGWILAHPLYESIDRPERRYGIWPIGSIRRS